MQFNFNTIQVATEDFSDSNKLGQGGFGAVYRVGTLSNSDTHHQNSKYAIPPVSKIFAIADRDPFSG